MAQKPGFLIHIEVQSQYQSGFAQRMYTYNYRLGDRYNRPVASLAILADDRPSWKPKSYKKTTLGTKMQFDFSIAKLLDFAQNWSRP